MSNVWEKPRGSRGFWGLYVCLTFREYPRIRVFKIFTPYHTLAESHEQGPGKLNAFFSTHQRKLTSPPPLNLLLSCPESPNSHPDQRWLCRDPRLNNNRPSSLSPGAKWGTHDEKHTGRGQLRAREMAHRVGLKSSWEEVQFPAPTSGGSLPPVAAVLGDLVLPASTGPHTRTQAHTQNIHTIKT